MIQFAKEHKTEIIIITIWVCFLNIYRISTHVVGVDTEEAILDLNANLNWTMGSGRFASAILRKIMMLGAFNYDWALIYMIVGWILICLGYIYSFEKLGFQNHLYNTIFCVLLCSCPIWAEQNYFLCSIYVNVYGFVFTIASALLFAFFIDNKGYKKLIVVIILSAIAIGIYQALLYVLLFNCVFFVTLKYYNKNVNIRKYWGALFKIGGMIVSVVLIYFICSKICIHIFYHSNVDYAGFTNSGLYINSKVRWFHDGFGLCIRNIFNSICDSFSKQPYGLRSYLYCLIFFIILCSIKLIIQKEKRNIILIIGTICALLCVFAGNFVLGNLITIREQFVLPVFVSGIIWILLYNISQIIKKFNEAITRIVMVIMVLFCFCIIIKWSSTQLALNRTDYIRYCADETYADRVMWDIKDKVGNYNDKKIVFVGANQWRLSENYLKGEIIGYSVFAWDADGPVGVNYRAYGMLNAFGYSYQKPTIEEVQDIFKVCENQNLLENDRVVLYDDQYILVDLNEF